MKKIFFPFLLCGLFFTITTLFGVEKIYISNGILNYCLSPDVANSAVVFYSFDSRDRECKQYYLPITIVPEIYSKKAGNKQIIKFPLAWYMNSKELFVVFHDLFSDAMGRVTFLLFSTDKPHDFDFLSFKDYEYQNNIMKFKGKYFDWEDRKHIKGISSAPFAITRLTNNSKIWYDFADKNIIARFPYSNDKQENWMPSENPAYYKWMLYAIKDDKIIVIQDDKLKDFTPLSSISVKGKKIYADNGETINFPNDIDSIIWGIDNNSTPSIILLSQSDKIKISKKNYPKLPKLILVNEDSNYVMFIFDRKIDSLNVQGSLQEIKDMLEKSRLLQQYSPRPKKGISEKAVKTTEDVQHTTKGLLDNPSPEETERRKAEFLANQSKDNIFTEDEFNALFPKVEYDKVTDLYERGMAYDWDEKFSDAMKCFEQDSSLKSKFMLAMYYKTGRPEITKDSVKTNVIFKEIIGDVSNKSAPPTPEMLCIAGRACMEFIPIDFTERQEFQKNAEKFFKESIKQGYASAAFYPQYYIKNNSKFQPQELIEIANKNNCLDAEVLAAEMALLGHPAFKNYRNKQENLVTIKKGIQAHIPMAEYILGELFNLDGTNPGGVLKPNPELAKFWIKRAANHGEPDAIELLRQNPNLRPFNR